MFKFRNAHTRRPRGRCDLSPPRQMWSTAAQVLVRVQILAYGRRVLLSTPRTNRSTPMTKTTQTLACIIIIITWTFLTYFSCTCLIPLPARRWPYGGGRTCARVHYTTIPSARIRVIASLQKTVMNGGYSGSMIVVYDRAVSKKSVPGDERIIGLIVRGGDGLLDETGSYR